MKQLVNDDGRGGGDGDVPCGYTTEPANSINLYTLPPPLVCPDSIW